MTIKVTSDDLDSIECLFSTVLGFEYLMMQHFAKCYSACVDSIGGQLVAATGEISLFEKT